MKYSLAASFALTALVGAVPLNNKRDVVYSTATVEEWVTEWSTTTVWEGEEPYAAATPTPAGGFYEVTSNAVASPTIAPFKPSVSVSSASSSYIAPASPIAPTSAISSAIPSAIAPSSSIPSAVVPTSAMSSAIAPTSPVYSAYITPAAISSAIAPVSSMSSAVAPASAISSATTSKPVTEYASTSSSGSGSFTGDMTYYDVSVGLTSCGSTGTNSEFLVAMNKADMANGINPNNNVHCNQYIDIYYNGVGPIKGKVVDTCPVCVSGAIDVTDSLFKAVAPSGDGRVHGVSWSWA